MLYESHHEKKGFCLSENKDADQLCSYTADQHLCFHFSDGTIPLLLKFKVSSIWLSSVTVQASLYPTPRPVSSLCGGSCTYCACFFSRLCPALKAVFEHGLKRHSLLGSICHPWLFIEEVSDLSYLVRKPTICICENKDADQLRDNREADQRLCFHHSDSTIPLPLKYERERMEDRKRGQLHS